MDSRKIADEAAAQLGSPVDRMQTLGENLRVEKRKQFPAEKWVADADTPLHSLIDHTMLKADATTSEIEALCHEAALNNFPAVCVNPLFVGKATAAVAKSEVKVAATVGFPLGAATAMVKSVEATECIAHGAKELDMVIPVGLLKAGALKEVFDHISAVVSVAKSQALVKVILETALLTQEEIVLGCLLSQWAGADYVKTSTGFGPGGATTEEVSLMRSIVGDKMGVKAAGGIRNASQAKALVAAGASRIGTSRGTALLEA